MRGKLALAVAALALVLGTTTASAAVLTVASYSTPNGDGQAHGGTYNYWDGSYNGTGSKTTDGALLTGGAGDLTDGVVATGFWYNVENAAGTGPYVGWLGGATPNPLLTFNFAGTPSITGIDIQIDNSDVGGVVAPASILVDGVSRAFTAPASGTVGTISLTGLNLVGPTHTIEFDQTATSTWVFTSEITFLGSPDTAVPEPASWAMLIGGFGLVGGAMRRRNVSTRARLA